MVNGSIMVSKAHGTFAERKIPERQTVGPFQTKGCEVFYL